MVNAFWFVIEMRIISIVLSNVKNYAICLDELTSSKLTSSAAFRGVC